MAIITNNCLSNFNVGTFVVDGVSIVSTSGAETYSNVSDLIFLRSGGEGVHVRPYVLNDAANLFCYLENTSTDAASHAKLNYVLTADASAYDVTFEIRKSDAAKFIFGLDNSLTGDPFVFSIGNALSTNPAMNFSTAGELTMPTQPCFNSYLSTAVTNVTGNGAVYSLLSSSSTEVFDLAGNLSNQTFTAPTTGKYVLISCVMMGGLTAAANYSLLYIVTSNKTYNLSETTAGTIKTYTNFYIQNGSVLADMDLGDTVVVQLIVDGEASDVTNINGGATEVTYFHGYLAC